MLIYRNIIPNLSEFDGKIEIHSLSEAKKSGFTSLSFRVFRSFAPKCFILNFRDVARKAKQHLKKKPIYLDLDLLVDLVQNIN